LKRKFTKEKVLERLRKIISTGKPIIGAGSSAGIIAKCAEVGGADLIIVYSTGLSRLQGLPTTPYGPMDTNKITISMIDELLNVVKDTPIIGGVDASDPTCWDLEKLLKKFIDAGFSGIINFPTIAMYEGRWRQMREPQGLSWSREVEMMRTARKMNIFTMAYVWSPEDARDMAQIPVDVICSHVGGTAGGLVGYKAVPLETALQNAQKIIQAAREVKSDIICLAHGGPFAEPEDTKHLYEQTDAQGFVGASSIERIPVEKAVIEVVERFKSIPVRKKK
jgi:predicted TIM-barrel enzyme